MSMALVVLKQIVNKAVQVGYRNAADRTRRNGFVR